MIFPNRMRNPRNLVIALLWPRILHPTAHFGPDFMDGVRGGLLGVSLDMNLSSAILAGRQKRSAQN